MRRALVEQRSCQREGLARHGSVIRFFLEDRPLLRRTLQMCFCALLQLIRNVQDACAGIEDARLRMHRRLEQQDVTHVEKTKDLQQQIASLQSAASTSRHSGGFALAWSIEDEGMCVTRLEEKVHVLSGSFARLEEKLATELEKSKKATYQIQRMHSRCIDGH